MEKKEKKVSKSILIIATFLIIIFIILMNAWINLQKNMFFHPWNDTKAYNELKTIDEFQEINIVNEDVNLSGWFWNIQKSDTPAPVIIFFTGNAQNSSNTMYEFYNSNTMRDIFGKYNLVIVDYPGYGFSKGEPSDKTMFEASDYIIDYVYKMPNVDSNNILIMGYSIGTGVATYCASRHDANALILIAPYDNALSLYNDMVNSFHGPMESLTTYKFDSVKYARDVQELTLIFTSKADEVIDYKHSLDLANFFENRISPTVLDKVDHNSYFKNDTVLQTIKVFIDGVIV